MLPLKIMKMDQKDHKGDKNSTKNEQKKIINRIIDDIIAVGDLIKLK